MSYSYLLLGPILFQNFELPDSISWGGRQSLAVHQLPGGTRVIHAMGRDDSEITWCGVFSGTNAGARARAIDLLRAEGNTWPLSWETFFYSVVVSRYDADYRRPNWIPYRISCTVLRDEAESLVETAISVTASLVSDVTAAGSLAGSLAPGLLSTAAIGALGAYGSTTYGSAAHTAATSQLSGITATNNQSLAATGTQLTATTNMTHAKALSGQAAQLAAARGYLQRASVNLANAGT